jgi:hypothetical protein
MISTLIDWKKSTPIFNKRDTGPDLFINSAISKTMEEFYSYLNIVNNNICNNPEVDLQKSISKNLVISIKVAIASSDT